MPGASCCARPASLDPAPWAPALVTLVTGLPGGGARRASSTPRPAAPWCPGQEAPDSGASSAARLLNSPRRRPGPGLSVPGALIPSVSGPLRGL